MDDTGLVWQFLDNFRHNLFKPLLLFFYMGFSVPLLRVPFDFPHVVYQGLTIYLLISIGWHGGEELAGLVPQELMQAGGLMAIGFVLNFLIGCAAYVLLRMSTRLRQIDAATVAGYYGSDSAGTFVTCIGVLTAMKLSYAAYMPVMLAVMEIPGCLVALYLVSRLRNKGMDALGNMPNEPGYDPAAKPPEPTAGQAGHAGGAEKKAPSAGGSMFDLRLLHEVFFNPGLFLLFGGIFIGYVSGYQRKAEQVAIVEFEVDGSLKGARLAKEGEHLVEDEPRQLPPTPLKTSNAPLGTGGGEHAPGTPEARAAVIPLEKYERVAQHVRQRSKTSMEQLDMLFSDLFQGLLCLFLLEMGMTACRRLRDLRAGGVPFVAFGLIAPNLFAVLGMVTLHLYGMLLHKPFDLGTYPLFAVLCGAASYIAVPAVQRMAIPEASPTLPLAASLGLTFSYNVTIGIPLYILIAQVIVKLLPIA